MDTEKKKKIVVLVMSCQDPFFKKEEVVCRDTWAKPILKGKYDNIEYYDNCEEEEITSLLEDYKYLENGEVYE